MPLNRGSNSGLNIKETLNREPGQISYLHEATDVLVDKQAPADFKLQFPQKRAIMRKTE